MRMRGVGFPPSIPTSINFSDLSPRQESTLQEFEEDQGSPYPLDKEILLLRTLSTLTSDKERCIFLLEILREYGYQIDYTSMAHALNIKLRWFMRVKKNVWKKVRQLTA